MNPTIEQLYDNMKASLLNWRDEQESDLRELREGIKTLVKFGGDYDAINNLEYKAMLKGNLIRDINNVLATGGVVVPVDDDLPF